MDHEIDHLKAQMAEIKNELNTMRAKQSNATLGDQANGAMSGTSPNVPIIASQSNPTAPVETQSNVDTSADFHLNDAAVENDGDDTNEVESDLPVASGSGKINKPQGSNQPKSGDSNLPITRERLIMLKARSTFVTRIIYKGRT